jgi:AraC family transcriptional regulator
MTGLRAVSRLLAPEDILSSANNFGVRGRLLHASHGGVHLQQYECPRGGGLRHEPLTSWRITYQQTGAPRIHRVLEGSSELQLRPAGKISISPPDAQRWRWDCDNRITILWINEAILDEVATGAALHGCRGHLQTPLTADDDLVRHTILGMLSECSIGSKVSSLLIDCAGRHVAAHLLARYSRALLQEKTSGMAQWKLRRALDYIEEHIEQDLSLEDLSKGLDMTPHYFCRSFRKSVGMPPYRYLITRRIERAKELLASTDKEVTEIALEVGFSSPSHFTTAFRRSVGYAPRMYRNSARRQCC